MKRSTCLLIVIFMMILWCVAVYLLLFGFTSPKRHSAVRQAITSEVEGEGQEFIEVCKQAPVLVYDFTDPVVIGEELEDAGGGNMYLTYKIRVMGNGEPSIIYGFLYMRKYPERKYEYKPDKVYVDPDNGKAYKQVFPVKKEGETILYGYIVDENTQKTDYDHAIRIGAKSLVMQES